MCGIAGIVSVQPGGLDEPLCAMLATLHHRGPDGEGNWVGHAGQRLVALGQTRLAIIDLTEAGRQPMLSTDERYVLIYNGEVYNYLELKSELAARGVAFRSRTDTEVVLQALVAWGSSAVERFNGMWAFALLDKLTRRLILSRDRLGVKPLYLYHDRRTDTLYFASEIKAILAGCRDRFALNPMVVTRYLEQQQIAAQPETFFKDIEELPPATLLELDLDANVLQPFGARRFWRLSLEEAFSGTQEERIAVVRETFCDSVRLRLRSDVPVGVLLSE